MLRIHKALACLAIGTAAWLAALGRPELQGGARTAVLLVRRGEEREDKWERERERAREGLWCVPARPGHALVSACPHCSHVCV